MSTSIDQKMEGEGFLMIKIHDYLESKQGFMDEYITQTRISHARSCIKKHGLKEVKNPLILQKLLRNYNNKKT